MPEDVLTVPSPSGSEVVSTPVPVVPEEPTATPGSKTPQENLLAALKEERQLRKEAEERARIQEERIVQLQSSQLPESEVFSDEGKHLDSKISSVSAEIQAIRDEREIEKLQSQFPVLKDKSSEFDEFRKDYPRHKLENVAKLFLVERQLLEPEQPRAGLERPNGGSKTPVLTGMTVEEAENLRKNNFRQYQKMIEEGKITIQG